LREEKTRTSRPQVARLQTKPTIVEKKKRNVIHKSHEKSSQSTKRKPFDRKRGSTKQVGREPDANWEKTKKTEGPPDKSRKDVDDKSRNEKVKR